VSSEWPRLWKEQYDVFLKLFLARPNRILLNGRMTDIVTCPQSISFGQTGIHLKNELYVIPAWDWGFVHWSCIFMYFLDYSVLIDKDHIKWNESIPHPKRNCARRFVDKPHTIVIRQVFAVHEADCTFFRRIYNFDIQSNVRICGFNFDKRISTLGCCNARHWRKQQNENVY